MNSLVQAQKGRRDCRLLHPRVGGWELLPLPYIVNKQLQPVLLLFLSLSQTRFTLLYIILDYCTAHAPCPLLRFTITVERLRYLQLGALSNLRNANCFSSCCRLLLALLLTDFASSCRATVLSNRLPRCILQHHHHLYHHSKLTTLPSPAASLASSIRSVAAGTSHAHCCEKLRSPLIDWTTACELQVDSER